MKESPEESNFINQIRVSDFQYELYPVAPMHIENESAEESEDPEKRRAPKRKNELKDLSCKIKEFLGRNGPADRLEIANQFCNEFSAKKGNRTMRKRVYDALNVLIAASVIKTEGQKLFLSDQQRFKEMLVRNKKEKLRSLVLKFQGLKYIYEEQNELQGQRGGSATPVWL